MEQSKDELLRSFEEYLARLPDDERRFVIEMTRRLIGEVNRKKATESEDALRL